MMKDATLTRPPPKLDKVMKRLLETPPAPRTGADDGKKRGKPKKSVEIVRKSDK